ncbi:MAG: hypothetical protein ACRDVL_11510 [Acidimicrobiia bacterium]
MSKRRIWLISLVVGALVATSGVAFASEHDEDKDDTIINFGYDEVNHLLSFNFSSTDGLYDCTLQTAETSSEYEVAYITSEGLIEVEGLTLDGNPVTFPNRPQEDLAEGLTAADAPGDYETATDCQLETTEIAGPNGQINHGMFMKAVHSLYDGAHRGCVMRHFAQSDLGKGDQQILTSEADAEFEPGDGAASFTGTVEFTTAVSDCERDHEDDAELSDGNGKGKGKGRPDWAGKGRPDSPGKSGSAPGHGR